MNSITKELGPEDIFSDIKMMRQSFDGALILLEGASDIKRFKNFFDEGFSSITNCFGKTNLLGAIRLVSDSPIQGCIALADADFDRVLGRLETFPGLIYSEAHDFDLDLFRTDATKRYLEDVADPQKCQDRGEHSEIVDLIISSISSVSYAKAANEVYSLGYAIKSIEWHKFYDNFKLDIGKLFAKILGKRVSDKEAMEDLKKRIEEIRNRNLSLWEITNGHDVCWALGSCLQNHLGNRAKNQCSGKEIELHLRLAFDDNDFKSTNLYSQIVKWEKASGYIVLKNHLR